MRRLLSALGTSLVLLTPSDAHAGPIPIVYEVDVKGLFFSLTAIPTPPFRAEYFVGERGGVERRAEIFFSMDRWPVKNDFDRRVVGASLAIKNPPNGFGSPSGSETLLLYGLTLNGSPTDIFHNIGTGPLYGSYEYNASEHASDTIQRLLMPLNDVALLDIARAVRGEAPAGHFFTIGALLADLQPGGNDEFLFSGVSACFGPSNFSNCFGELGWQPVLRLQVVPEPAGIALLGLGLITVVMQRRQRRCR
jgi:hypothetical protein